MKAPYLQIPLPRTIIPRGRLAEIRRLVAVDDAWAEAAPGVAGTASTLAGTPPPAGQEATAGSPGAA